MITWDAPSRSTIYLSSEKTHEGLEFVNQILGTICSSFIGHIEQVTNPRYEKINSVINQGSLLFSN